MTTDKHSLKSWFIKGKKPLEAHFAAWIDSYWHKAEQIPTSSIKGLEATLNNKAEISETQTIKKNVADIIDGTIPVEKALYAEKLGTAADHYTKTTLDNRLATFQTKTGDGQSITVTFSQASKRENVASGENLYSLFGKIARWFTDLKAVAFSGSVSDLTETPDRLFVTPGEKTRWNGKADLDGSGKIPASQLPSYVDDVLTYASMPAFPGIGEDGKIYIATDTNRQYRWSGSAYVEISASLALGETASTAYRGDRGKIAYDYAVAQRTIGEIKDLQTILNGKSDTTHTHPISSIDNLQTELNKKINTDDVRLTNARPANGGNAETVDKLHAAAVGVVEAGKLASYDNSGNFNANIFHDNWPTEDINIAEICYRFSAADGYHRFCTIAKLRETMNLNSFYVPKTGGTYSGYVDFTEGAGNSGSDMRFKTNVAPLENILDDLLDLQIISYTWTKEGENRRNTFGLSATQLLEKGGNFRKIVHERGDEEKTKWVEYDRIGVLALKGLQEMAAELRNAKQQLETQQQDINTLKQQIAELQRQMQTLANLKTQE